MLIPQARSRIPRIHHQHRRNTSGPQKGRVNPAMATTKKRQGCAGILGTCELFAQVHTELLGHGQGSLGTYRKDVPFNWTTRRQQKFEQIKRDMTKTPLLRIFDTTKPVWIETDASLTQDHNGQRHPVAYYSRQMSPAEQNYDSHDKELPAIVASLRHWRMYCEGAPQLTILSTLPTSQLQRNLPKEFEIQ